MQVPAHASCGGWLYGRTVTQGVAQGARHRGRERCVAGVVAHGGDALADEFAVAPGSCKSMSHEFDGAVISQGPPYYAQAKQTDLEK